MNRADRTPDARPARGRRWWPLVLLVLAGGSRWMLAGVHPEAESTLASQTAGCLWAALVSLMLLRRGPAQASLRRSWRGMVAGALALCGPQIGLLLHTRDLDPGGLTMALALTPVVIAVAAAALGTGVTDDAPGRIWPGIAAVGGLLLVLAEPSLSGVRNDLALVLAPLLTGFGAALLSERVAPSRWRATTALTGATAVLAMALLGSRLAGASVPHFSLLATACDGVIALLSIYALLGLGATRWSAQFTLLPLLVLLEGIPLVRPAINSRWVVGLGLLVLASVSLLAPPAEEAAADA